MWIRGLILVFFVLVGCGQPGPAPEQLSEQTVDAGCGMCQYGVVSKQGCYWAIEWKGEMLIAQGEVPVDHENHAPDGMCNMKRKAIVSGLVKSGQFYSKQFDLVAVDAVPTTPQFTPLDKH